MRKAAAILCLATLGACATEGVRGTSVLAGKPFSDAYALYGPWDEETTLEGSRLYIWRRHAEDGDGVDRFCEMRVEMGFRDTIRDARMQGFPAACELFTVRYEVLDRDR